MKTSVHAALAATFASLAFAMPVAASEAPAPAATPHKPDCSHDTDAKGQPRPDCDVRTTAREPQTHKMVRCNEEAGKKQLHGDERRAFMSACLKG